MSFLQFRPSSGGGSGGFMLLRWQFQHQGSRVLPPKPIKWECGGISTAEEREEDSPLADVSKNIIGRFHVQTSSCANYKCRRAVHRARSIQRGRVQEMSADSSNSSKKINLLHTGAEKFTHEFLTSNQHCRCREIFIFFRNHQ